MSRCGTPIGISYDVQNWIETEGGNSFSGSCEISKPDEIKWRRPMSPTQFSP